MSLTGHGPKHGFRHGSLVIAQTRQRGPVLYLLVNDRARSTQALVLKKLMKVNMPLNKNKKKAKKNNPNLYIYIHWDPHKMSATGPGHWFLILVRVIPKTQKRSVDAFLFNTQHYKVRIKGKVEQSRVSRIAPSLHLGIVANENSVFRSPSTSVTDITYFLYIPRNIYIYIYIYLAKNIRISYMANGKIIT